MRWELSLDRELVREVFVIRISSRSSLCTSRITNTQDIPTDPRSRKEEATQRERFSLRGRNVFLIGDSQIAQLSESPDAASGAVRNFRHVPGATVGRSGRRGLPAALASKSLRIRSFSARSCAHCRSGARSGPGACASRNVGEAGARLMFRDFETAFRDRT